MESEEKPRPVDATGNPIYRIPEGNLEALTVRVEKLNRRAKKLGVEPLVLTNIGEEFETKRKQIKGYYGDDDVEFITGAPKYIEYQVRIALVTLTGACPRINGWTFAATINHEEGGNILRVAPDFETCLPLKYRTVSTECEHCSTNRRRNDTYVLQSGEGEWKQVGRNCLADFLRTENPNGIAQWAEVIASLADEIGSYEDESFGEGGGRGERYFGTLTLLTQVSCCVRNDGWCSRGEARASFVPKCASVDQALMWFDDKFVAKAKPETREKYTPSAQDKTDAAAAIEWAQSIGEDVTNDYLWNIRTVSHKEAVKGRDAGLAGSIIVAHKKHLERELAKKYEDSLPSEHFGTVGERAVFTLTITGTREIESNYGCTTLVMFRDAEGNRAKWFASSPTIPLELDVPLTVKATVKKHDLYHDKKQTVLSRVVLHVEKESKPRAKRVVCEEVTA